MILAAFKTWTTTLPSLALNPLGVRLALEKGWHGVDTVQTRLQGLCMLLIHTCCSIWAQTTVLRLSDLVMDPHGKNTIWASQVRAASRQICSSESTATLDTTWNPTMVSSQNWTAWPHPWKAPEHKWAKLKTPTGSAKAVIHICSQDRMVATRFSYANDRLARQAKIWPISRLQHGNCGTWSVAAQTRLTSRQGPDKCMKLAGKPWSKSQTSNSVDHWEATSRWRRQSPFQARGSSSTKNWHWVTIWSRSFNAERHKEANAICPKLQLQLNRQAQWSAEPHNQSGQLKRQLWLTSDPNVATSRAPRPWDRMAGEPDSYLKLIVILLPETLMAVKKLKRLKQNLYPISGFASNWQYLTYTHQPK